MELTDKPGALAKVATILGDNGVSIDRMRQYGHPGAANAPVLIVTHKTARPNLDDGARRDARYGRCHGAACCTSDRRGLNRRLASSANTLPSMETSG